MNGDDLKSILCRLHPGMSLTVPDEWLDQNIPGTNVKRAAFLSELAMDLGCVIKHGMGVQTFEKLSFPRTG